MADNETKPVEIATLIFTVINTLAVGIGGYFLIGRQEAEMFRSTTNLNNIQSELSRVQLEIAKSNAQMDLLFKSANTAEKSIELLEAVRPKLDFKIDKQISHEGGNLTITFELSNNGEFEFLIKPTKFVVSDKPYRNNLAGNEEHKIYLKSFNLAEIDTVRSLGPRQARGHTFSAKLINNVPKKAFYYMEYTAETRRDIVKIVDQMAQQLGVTSVVPLSKQVVYRYGILNL